MPKNSSLSRGSVSAPSRPIAGPEAFRDLEQPSHVQSQAATLLLIGEHLRGDILAIQARFALAHPAPGEANPFPAADITALGFPSIRVTGERFPDTALRALAGTQVAPAVRPRTQQAQTAQLAIPFNAEKFYADANSQTAAALLEASLHHPQPLARVAAARSYMEVAVDPTPAIKILEDGIASRDFLVRDVAAYALADVDPKNPNLQKLLRPRRLRSRRKRSRTSTIIHGTWAASSPWWQPNGDFWTYLHDSVDRSLYGASDRFGWTGGYSDAARALAGTEFQEWVQQHRLDGLDLYTHSHGGSVAMLANHAGTTVGKMVLLSCPVHWPKYTPDFSNTQRVISIRVHMDLVILADRGGQRFSDPRIQENVLPLWFNHFATHDPANWKKYNIPSML